MESIYNEVDMSVLPSEYLPDDYSGPTAGSHNDIIGKYVIVIPWVVRLYVEIIHEL